MTTLAVDLNTPQIWHINSLIQKNVRSNLEFEVEFTGKSRALVLRQMKKRLGERIAEDEFRVVECEWSNEVALHYTLEDIKTMKRHLSEIDKYIQQESEPLRDITDEMISRAKSYPIERLVDFDRSGKATAFCHEDKSPSLSWWRKGNKAVCWPCDKKYDPIDILVQRDKMSFAQAVKRLQ